MGCFSKWDIGGCGCGCGVTFQVLCGSANVNGATVTIKTGGGVVVATGTTNAFGLVVLTIPSAGTYTVSATGGTCTGITRSMSLACGNTYTLGCCVVNCAPCALPTSNLTLTWSGGNCTPGSASLTYTTSFPPNIGVYWLGPIGTAACCGADGGQTRVGISCHGGAIAIQWWGNTTLFCQYTGAWTVVSCSPLHITTNTGSFSNTCGGNCPNNVDNVNFTLTG